MRKWLDRQNFLGVKSDQIFSETVLGVAGLGGGGSHIILQAAHLGIKNFVIADPDIIDETNLNRLVGGTTDDVKRQRSKVDIAERIIRAVQPDANIIKIKGYWQEAPEKFKKCDIIVGGLDSIRAKDELDSFSRRYLVPYLDMGMDVHQISGEFLISGQVILSMPGKPCLRCFGIVTDAGLAEEAKAYGAAGGRPQVVWPNAILASSAIGLLVQLLTPWNKNPPASAYLEYDGNIHSIKTSEKFRVRQNIPCPHYPLGQVGDVGFDIRGGTCQEKEGVNSRMQLSWLQRIILFLKGRR